MPAKSRYRINEAGIYSHIYNKGIEKRKIFNDEEDYNVFLSYLEDYLAPRKDPESVKKVFEINGRTYKGTPHQPKNYHGNVELVAYSLMPDHFHLLLHQVTQGFLEKFLRSLMTRYSMYFNKKYQRTGALFEGPYKSVQIEEELRILFLTGFLHHAEDHSSYSEYLGKRETLWVKPKVVQSFFEKAKTDLFKGAHSYKDFVEKYELDENTKKLLDGVIFDSITQDLERSDPSRKEEISADSPVLVKSRSKKPLFFAFSTALYMLLIGVGFRNVVFYSGSLSQDLQASNHSELKTQVLPAATEATKAAKPDKPKETVKIKASEGATFVNVRLMPTTTSDKVGHALNGEVLEFLSEDRGWYEVRLVDGSTGFISSRYAIKEDK